MQLPLHLWMPRAVAWIGVLFVAVLGVVWLAAPPQPDNDLLGLIGGTWAICRVIQFLLMTRGAQAVLIWIGGRSFRAPAEETARPR